MSSEEVGVKFSVIGLGHAGSKVAKEFFNLGYKTLIINSSRQDLSAISGPIKLAIGEGEGAGKDRELAKNVLKKDKNLVLSKIKDVFPVKNHALLIAGLGGGTGSGIVAEVSRYLKDIGFDYVSVLAILPLTGEDPGAKRNTLKTLKEITLGIPAGNIISILIADNSNMYKLFPNTNIAEFWNVANKEIVKQLHTFNKMCTLNTEFTALDPQDFKKILRTPGCITFGTGLITKFDRVGIKDALTEHFNHGMMASGFDPFSATIAGVILIGDKAELEKMPKESEGLIFKEFDDYINGGSLFRGVYSAPSLPLSVYSIIGGMGVPYDKVHSLKEECTKQETIAENKTFEVNEEAFDV